MPVLIQTTPTLATATRHPFRKTTGAFAVTAVTGALLIPGASTPAIASGECPAGTTFIATLGEEVLCEVRFTDPDENPTTWEVPEGITSIAALLVGGGGAGKVDSSEGYGGGGGEVLLVSFDPEDVEELEVSVGARGVQAEASGGTAQTRMDGGDTVLADSTNNTFTFEARGGITPGGGGGDSGNGNSGSLYGGGGAGGDAVFVNGGPGVNLTRTSETDLDDFVFVEASNVLTLNRTLEFFTDLDDWFGGGGAAESRGSTADPTFIVYSLGVSGLGSDGGRFVGQGDVEHPRVGGSLVDNFEPRELVAPRENSGGGGSANTPDGGWNGVSAGDGADGIVIVRFTTSPIEESDEETTGTSGSESKPKAPQPEVAASENILARTGVSSMGLWLGVAGLATVLGGAFSFFARRPISLPKA